jgi:hypothetical protein
LSPYFDRQAALGAWNFFNQAFYDLGVGIAIWREFRSSGEAWRKEIMQELESLRWPQFTVPSGK